MTETQLYFHLLGLEEPWIVTKVEMDIANQAVNVFVGPKSGTRWKCPDCGQVCKVHDYMEERRWRHLDSCGFPTYLFARIPRVACDEHGVKSVSVPWATPKSRFTISFESFAILVLQGTKAQNRTAALLGLSAGQVHHIMHRAVARGLARRNSNDVIRYLGLDEKSFHRGHEYITVLSDISGRRVLDVGYTRTLEATVALLEGAVSQKQRATVEAVSMDMWVAYDSARKQVLPNADTVHDRFHIMRYLGEGVDKTRRDEHRELQKFGIKVLSGTKFLWLSSIAGMSMKNFERFMELEYLYLPERDQKRLDTAQSHMWKEDFEWFFHQKTVEEGKELLEGWCQDVMKSNIKHMIKVAQILERHKEGILTYLKHKITNGPAEGLNALIQEVKTVSRGFRRFANFRCAILFFLGGLDLHPHKTP